MILQLLKYFIFIKIISAACTFYDNSNYWYQVIDSDIDWIDIDISIFKFLEKLGVGFWFNYMPNSESLTSQTFITNPTNYLLYIVEDVEATEYSIIFYLEINSELKKIKLKGVIQYEQQSKDFEYLFDLQNFEGDWHLLYYYIDQASQEVVIYVLNYRVRSLFTLKQNGIINYGSKTFQRNFGQFQIFQGSEVIKYKYFPGKLGYIFVTFFNNLFSNLDQFYLECPVQYLCSSSLTTLVNYNQEFKKNKLIQKSIGNSIQQTGYVIQGWVKIDKIEQRQQLDTVLLRMTTRYQYFNEKQYGDKLLYIVYHQNIIQDQNGLSVSTNSYTFPIIEENYKSDELDKIIIMGKQYSEAIIYWHYIQYEIGTTSNDGQPLFTVYFAFLNQKQQWKWNKQINHFTNSRFYLFIGGDDFVSNLFSGFLSDLTFTLYCNPTEVQFKIKCHYSCKTCDGILSSNCLSCNSESHRLYSKEQKICQCAYGYMEITDKETCLTLEENMGNLQIKEYERKCNKIGYFNCNEDDILCDYGYFQIGNECLKCPKFNEQQLDDSIIECGDCLINPEQFSTQLMCTYDFKLMDEYKKYAYQNISRGAQSQEVFQIFLNEFGNLQLIQLEGIFQDICRYGYYKDVDGKCKKCIEGCLGCYVGQTCTQCQIGYIQRKDGICIKCKACHNCMLENNKEVCLYQDDCLSTQYWSNYQCYDCGQYCAKCTQSKCLYCIDNEQYFLTFDKLNCAICNIKNCQYCFQYYVSANKYYTTLDYEPFLENIQNQQIRIGCAQCNFNMFFNFLTNQCEIKPDDQIECFFGIITQTSGIPICIKSFSPLLGIQQTQCNSLSYCTNCILNYINTDGFCITCSDGYYSSITTGQCKQCPVTCKTCQQQNNNHQDYWKWDIKAFYKYFVNSDDNHSFEQYGINYQTQDFKIVCTSCFSDSFLYQNICYKNCGQDCNDCQIIKFQSTYIPQCFQCNNALYNTQKSIDENDITICKECVVFCKACIQRELVQINQLNPFITKLNKYTNLCYSFDQEKKQSDEDLQYNVKYKDNINFHPYFRTPYKCQTFNKCIKTLTINQLVFCDSQYKNYVYSQDTRENFRNQYITYYEFTVYGLNFQDNIYKFLNEQSIMEIEINNLIKTHPNYVGQCIQWEAQNIKIINPFPKEIFTLNTVRFNLIGEQQTNLLTQTNFSLFNFNQIQFQNVGLSIHMTASHLLTSSTSILSQFNFNNSYFPLTFKLIDSKILSSRQNRKISFSIISNNSQNTLFDNVTFLNLNLTNSKVLDFRIIQSTKSPQFRAKNLIFQNLNFTSTSIFYFQQIQFSSNYNISISDVYANNITMRAGSFIINTTILNQYYVGQIKLENFYLENITLMNASQMFNLKGFSSCQIKNFTLKNIIFYDTSSFLLSNIIDIEDFIATDLIIYAGYLITNKGTQMKVTQSLKNEESIRIKNISFIQNVYHNPQCFISLFQNDILNNSILIDGLIMKNNQYYNILKGSNQIKSLTNEECLIYLECYSCIINQVNILRGLGYPEIAIYESRSLILSNIIIQQDPQFITKTLHSSYKCIEQYLFLDIFYVVYLSSFKQIVMENIIIFKSVIFDYPFLLFDNQNQLNEKLENTIVIRNSQFYQNMLLITQQNRYTSIIYIKTEQLTNISIINSNFTLNFLNEYFQDYQLFSSSTLVINAQLSNVQLSNCFFNQNVISNSTDSNLFIKTKYLNIQNSIFIKQNLITPELLEKQLFISKTDTEISNIILNFQILSSGGNAYLLINSMVAENLHVEQTIALNGGAFYIITSQEGSLIIKDSQFSNISTTINGYQLSVGGCLYIDSSKSRINLLIKNSNFYMISSRTQAGLLYIEPSFLQNEIELSYLTIQESFSIQHSILSFSPSRQTSVYSNFKIKDSVLMNSERVFEYYLSQIQDISSQDIKPFQRENPSIYVQYCNFTMLNCSITNFHIANILEIFDGYIVDLNNIEITNSTYYASPVIKISLREGFFGQLLIQNLRLKQLQQYKIKFEPSQEQEVLILKDLLCFDEISDIVQNPVIENTKINLTNQLIYNKNFIFQENSYNLSLVEIKNLNDQQELIIENTMLSNIDCSNCYFGVFNLMDASVNQMNLKIKNLSLTNNTCGVIGCLSFLKNSDFSLNQQNRILQNYVEKIEKIQKKEIEFTISNSQFINNSADYGGACFFYDFNMLIERCIFIDNSARQLGGAIYYYSKEDNNILILDSKLIQNKAQIGGGLYQNGESIQQLRKGNVYINENSGQKYADNIATQPIYLHLSLDGIHLLKNKQIFKNDTTLIDEVEVKPYSYFGSQEKTDQILMPSGLKIYDYKYFDPLSNSYINQNFSFRLIPLNTQFEQIKNLIGTECIINPSIVDRTNLNQKINNIFNNISEKSISYNQVLFSEETLDYNLDNLTIYYNPSQDSNHSLQLAFICKAIRIPIYYEYPPYELNYTLSNYILLLHIKTFKCQLGEYLNSSSGGCVQCDITQNQYSVQQNAQACQLKDDLKIRSIKPAMIELRSGYWRSYYDSNIIELCYHQQQNCQGGWFAGNPSCDIGHIGALCEQCDLYNIRGQGFFSIGQTYSCSSCQQVAKNIINITLVLLWTLLSLFISVTSTVQMIEEFIFQLKLKSLRNHIFTQPTSTSVLLKVFTNYLQIISSITSFQLSIPLGITLVVSGVGNPMDSMAFSLDCFLANSNQRIPILYFRIIFSLLMIGFYIFLFFSIYIILLIIKKSRFQITFITTTFIYIYIYLFPNIISGLIGLLSYRKISNEFWISGNVSYLYDTSEHTIWLISFVIPSFLILGLLIPFFFWFVVYYNRKQLNATKVRKMWGYLYNEYKLETYYWETLKILQKELIILVLLYYSDFVAVKASLVFLILYIYSHLSTKYKPYQSGPLNKIDFLSTSICSISIVLASSIYTAQSFDIIEVVLPFYSILAVLNFLFVATMLQKLIYAYFDKMEKTIDDLKSTIYLKFPHIINKNNTLKRIFFQNSIRKKLIKQRFKMIREYLISQAQQIIEFKSSITQDIGIPKLTTRKDDQTIITEPLSSSHRQNGRLLRYNKHFSKQPSIFSVRTIMENKYE